MMKKILTHVLFQTLLIPLLLPTHLVQAARVNETNVSRLDCSILDYDAVGDGKMLNTEAIQTAIDDCTKNGGGTVVIPEGSFLCGSLVLKNNVELHLETGATLLCSTDVRDYPLLPKCKYPCLYNAGGTRAFIYAEEQSNIALTGMGTIDGQGSVWKPGPRRGSFAERPRLILFVSCKRIFVEGVHLRSSPMWMQHYLDCDNVKVSGISVYNHANLNCDGIDIDGCRNVTISDSIFDSDDDGITLKSTGPAPTENVVINNCIVSSFCNAIKAGTESTGGFRNIAVTNCIVKPSVSKNKPFFGTPRIGITGLSLMIVDGGVMEGVTVNNLTIHGTMAPVYVRLGNRARPHGPEVPTPAVGNIRNVSMSNVVAYGAGSWGSSITGIPGHHVENISLSNVQLFNCGGIKDGQYKTVIREDEKGYPQPTAWGNLPAYGLYLRHATGITINGLVLGTSVRDERSAIWADDVQQLSIGQCRLSGWVDGTAFVNSIALKDYKIETPLGWNGKPENLIGILDPSQLEDIKRSTLDDVRMVDGVPTITFNDYEYMGRGYRWCGTEPFEFTLPANAGEKHVLHLLWAHKEMKRGAIVTVNGKKQEIARAGNDGWEWIQLPVPAGEITDNQVKVRIAPHPSAPRQAMIARARLTRDKTVNLQ